VPLLQSIIIFSDEVCTDLVVKHAFHSNLPVLNRQANYYFAHVLCIVVNDACGRHCILYELIVN
jgi:hypothetical protein